MRETYYTYVTIFRLIRGESFQVSATQLEEKLIMQTSAFFEKEKTNIYLTYILQIKLSHMWESYISKLYYLTQINQDLKTFLFKFAEGGGE